MNNILKHSAQLLLASCLILSAGCSDNLIEAPESVETSAQRLVLTASTSSPDTRMSLDPADGLKTMWEPGDQLVLYKKDGSQAPIYLSTKITSPSVSAKFESDAGVPSGAYWVIYNYHDDRAYYSHSLRSVNDINNENNLALYGELTVSTNVSQADITMKHMYAQVTIQLKNLASSNITPGYYQVGIYSPNKGFSLNQVLTPSGLQNAEYGRDPNSLDPWTYSWFPSNVRSHKHELGVYNIAMNSQTGQLDASESEGLSALIFPVDLSLEDVFFYLLFEENGESFCYEITKAKGLVKFQEGMRYKVVLDMEQATKTTLSKDGYLISNLAEWRHAVYRGDGGCSLTNDLDFENEYYFPLEASNINGDGHTIRNITINHPDEDCVGAFKYCNNVSNITLENVNITGKNKVGGIGNDIYVIENCKITGESSITGSGNYVGGIQGYLRMNDLLCISDVSMGSTCSVSGHNYVGGIIGGSTFSDNNVSFSSPIKLMDKCVFNGAVTATGDYVGGIFGRIGGDENNSYSTIYFNSSDYDLSLLRCLNYGTVSGHDYVGGVGGALHVVVSNAIVKDVVVLKSSLSQGNVTGNEHVGGILGSSIASLNTCYSIGTIQGSTKVGGVLGDGEMMADLGMSKSRVANCYSLATVNAGATTNAFAGGVVGFAGGGMKGATVEYSYFAGSVSGDGGIIGKCDGYWTVNSCLSTTSSLGDLGSNATQTNSLANVTSILANRSVINGEEAYSENVWLGYPNEPVKFSSFSADTEAPGFGDITID